MIARDAAPALRKVSALRALCVRLPHLATPLERERLLRFQALVEAPASASADDIEALVAGWRALWRAGRPDDLLRVAASLPTDLVERDRRLATYVVAARELTRAPGP